MNQYIIYGAVGLVVLFVIVYVKMTIDEKKGADSEEKRKIKEIVKRAVPNGVSYTAAYGTTEDFEIGGGGRRITTTTTYRYCHLTAGTLAIVNLCIIRLTALEWQKREKGC